MKLKSLFLGSAAALALTSGALAADPRSSFVSLDVCDAYGITGLTIASADTCLKISGSVSYEFHWGDYRDGGVFLPVGAGGPGGGGAATDIGFDNNNGQNDWRSRLETILRFEATTQTDAGAAKVHIGFRDRDYYDGVNNVTRGDAVAGPPAIPAAADRHPLRIQDAWVSFGDTTVLMAGKKSSIAKFGDDEPFNYLGLFNAKEADTGVFWSYDRGNLAGNSLRTGGHSIQIVSEVADGVSVGAGLESLDGTAANSQGTFVGFVEAKGAWGQAHATVVVGSILDNNAAVNNAWGFHTGATFNFDNFKVRGALAIDDSSYWNALLSAEGTFDLFTIAASAEFVNTGNTVVSGFAANTNQLGLGASVGFQATETVKINAGFRYFDNDTANAAAVTQGWQAALQVVAAVAEGVEASAAIGAMGGGNFSGTANDPVAYVDLGLTYKPGGSFETGVGLEANALGAYKLKFNAKKTF